MKTPTTTSAPLADARRMAAQQFSIPNIRRTLAQKHHLTPTAIDLIISQLTPHTPPNAPPCPAPQPR